MTNLLNHINSFKPITLEEMDQVALMKRVDTKFVVRINQLPSILEAIQHSYQVLEINENRLMQYFTSYFDTTGFQFYNNHHRGRKKRAKVRLREYTNSNINFIEVKQKNNKGQTVKRRISSPTMASLGSMESINSFYTKLVGQSIDLKLVISNAFDRFTLVNVKEQERITIDTNIKFNGQLWNPALAIIELKQKKLNRNSTVYRKLKASQIHPARISKYCLGMSTAYPSLKTNNFKPVFRNIIKNIA